MPVPTDITAGTLMITNGSESVTGVGTAWLASDLRQGDVILWIEGGDGFQTPILADVPTSNTALTLAEPWEGPTLIGVRYRIRYQWDSSRVSGQARQLIDLLDNGNVLALAGLTGPGVPVFDGPHSMTVRPESDFINGVAYDVQVDTLADRDAYDGQAAGFAVLVSNVGDGRSAVYSKASNASGDWTDPAYVTGPIGASPEIAAGTTTTLAPGSDATFTVDPDGSGGYLLNTGIPAGRGFTNRGAYDSGAAYVVDDVVTFAGSTFIAIQAVPSGNPPSSAMPPVSNAYWAVLAARGANGAGTVASVGAGGGIAVDPTDPTAPVVSLGNVPTTTIKGRVAAGTGAPTDLTGTQVNTILPVFGTAKGLVPGRTSAMGLFLRDDGTWQPAGSEDLEFTVAQMMMRLADIDNVAQFLGPNGNRFADSYDALTYVDVAGATNLSTATAGVLKPSVTQNQIPQATGTILGNMTDQGGIAAAFDGVTAAPFSSSARTVSGNQRGYVGKDWGSGQTRSLTGFKVWSPSTAVGFEAGGNNVRITLKGSNSAPTVWDGDGFGGTQLARNSSVAAGVGSNTLFQVLTGIPANTFRYHWVEVVYLAGASEVYIAEAQFFTSDANNLTVRSTNFSAPSAPTKMKALLNLLEVDAASAGTDYFVDVSRDGGTTWSAMTLTERYSLPSGLRVVEGAETDVSAQPSGTAPRYRLRTANNKNVEFHDTYLYWS